MTGDIFMFIHNNCILMLSKYLLKNTYFFQIIIYQHIYTELFLDVQFENINPVFNFCYMHM